MAKAATGEAIGNAVLPAGYRHIALGDVGSTNSECLERARLSDGGRLWITGARQLSGRGSRGRNWVSEPGNLYASLLLRDCAPLASLAQLTFLASLSVRDAITAAGLPGVAVTLKWPNDVLVDHKKTCGILLESHRIGTAQYAIIGIGLNIAHRPENTLHPATSLNEAGLRVTPDAVFGLLANAMDRRLTQWQGGANFADVRSDWLANCAKLGQSISVVIPSRDGPMERQGVFAGLGEQGELLLDEGGAISRLSVADIFFA